MNFSIHTERLITARLFYFKKGSDKMINALVTKNGQSALISLPAKRIGLARDLASIGVASPPSELYPHDDEVTVGLKYFGTDDFSGRLITLIQSEDSLARVNTLVELYGDLPVAQREKVKASVLSGEMTSLNDFKNSILENKSPEIVQNYYCPMMCTLYLRNRYGDLDYDPVEYDGEYNKAEGKTKSTILLLGRYGFDGDLLERSGLFEYITRGNKIKSVKYPSLDITFMTAHASKGLGYDNVIIVNGKNETFGFPSKIEDDPVLAFVIKGDRSIDYAEERRLFYVAMTRTKNRVFVVAPEQNPSEFLLEINP